MDSTIVVPILEQICLEKFHIIIGLIGFISGALSVTFLGRLPARRLAYVARRCGLMSKWCAQPDPPPFGDGMESIADHGADQSIEGLCLAPPYRGARRVHYSEESEPFRVDRLTPASDRMASRLLDLTVLPQVIYVSSGSLDTKWHLNKRCPHIDRDTVLTKEVCLTCLNVVRKANHRLFEVVKIDPNHHRMRTLTEKEIRLSLDQGGCEVCGERHYAEPNPLMYADCWTCDQRPCFHHGRCCPNAKTKTETVMRANSDGKVNGIDVRDRVCEVCYGLYSNDPDPLFFEDCPTCKKEPCFHHARCCPASRVMRNERDDLHQKDRSSEYRRYTRRIETGAASWRDQVPIPSASSRSTSCWTSDSIRVRPPTSRSRSREGL